MEHKPAVELYKELEARYVVSSAYRVGFTKELSPGVLDVIQHLKGNLNPEDIIPIPTSLTIVLKDKDPDKIHNFITDTFHQSSALYMDKFDETAFEDWAKTKLESKINN